MANSCKKLPYSCQNNAENDLKENRCSELETSTHHLMACRVVSCRLLLSAWSYFKPAIGDDYLAGNRLSVDPSTRGIVRKLHGSPCVTLRRLTGATSSMDGDLCRSVEGPSSYPVLLPALLVKVEGRFSHLFGWCHLANVSCGL